MSQTRNVLVRWDQWELHCLLALIALSGTDYSRGFPNVGPKKVWAMLPRLLPLLTSECMRTTDGKPHLVPDLTARYLYATVYTCAFGSHVRPRGPGATFSEVMGSLATSKLSVKTKTSLPTFARASCTAKNANFIMSYWLGDAPDSMDPAYGFREAGGLVEWDE